MLREPYLVVHHTDVEANPRSYYHHQHSQGLIHPMQHDLIEDAQPQHAQWVKYYKSTKHEQGVERTAVIVIDPSAANRDCSAGRSGVGGYAFCSGCLNHIHIELTYTSQIGIFQSCRLHLRTRDM